MPILAVDYAISVGRRASLQQWDHELNAECGLLPETIAHGEKEKVWWRCQTCGSSWLSRVGSVLARDELGCWGCRQKLKNAKSISDFPLSKERYELLLSEWDYERNEFNPDHKFPSNDDLTHWICPKSHSWSTTLRARTKKKGTNCPYCRPNILIPGFNDLYTVCFQDESKARILEEWDHERNAELGLTPQTIAANESKKSIYWKCLEAQHQWKTSVNNRMVGRNCSICSGRYAEPGSTDMVTLAAENERIEFLIGQWIRDRNDNLGLDPSRIGPGSNKHAWWRCAKGHEWFAQINSRFLAGYDCRKCSGSRSKGEIEVYEFLKKALDGRSVDHNVRGLAEAIEIDILVESAALGVEYNGNYWHSDNRLTAKGEWASAEEYHRFKLASAEAAGLKLAFVWEDDWKNRRSKVEAALLKAVDQGHLDGILTIVSKG